MLGRKRMSPKKSHTEVAASSPGDAILLLVINDDYFLNNLNFRR